ESSLPPIPLDGLIRHLDFENRLTDGTARGPLQYGTGILGSAAMFDGSQHVELSAGSGPDLEAPWSLSVWARPANTPLSCILSKVQPAGEGRGFELLWRKGHVSANLIHRRGASTIEVVSADSITADQWHHLAVTYDGSGNA